MIPGAIPGSNILNMAFRLIAKQVVLYYRDAGRSLNSVGQDITTYEPALTLGGSFQPVPRKVYRLYGLDLQKNYYMFYASRDILDITRDVSGDQISYQGQRFQCESNINWYSIDGWNGVLCIHIGEDITDPVLWGFGTIPATSTYQNFGHGTFIGSSE
jgi:hypothetical protein